LESEKTYSVSMTVHELMKKREIKKVMM